MTTKPNEIPAFASAFPAASEAQWRGLVDKVLKGGKFERLISRTADGIDIQPLYPRAAAAPGIALPERSGWSVLARVDNPDLAAANLQAKADLTDGATGLHLIFAGSASAHGFGLPAKAADLQTVLDGVDPATTAFELDLSPQAQDAPEHLADLITASGFNPASAQISFGHDPIGALALQGDESADWAALSPDFSSRIMSLARRGFRGPFCVADGRIAHAAGGSEAQELAWCLATALAYMRALEAAGASLEQAQDAIAFRLAADADQFLTIAKTRALRYLWARIETACGLTPRPVHIHGETAWRMMTRRDPWVNLLRGTIAAFSAATGGADCISVLPFTQALGLPDGFARRLARNTQLILLEEANIAKSADPAAGSGGIEDLTAQLCGKAWAIVQDMEKGGGAGQSSVRRTLAAAIAEVHGKRLKNIATRREPVTGVSEFPDISEQPVAVLSPLAARHGPRTAFSPRRNAEPFEALRDRAEAAAKRPQVFLANFGPLAAFNARATFARNLFEAGGIAAISNDGFENADALAQAFAQSGARLACICSSDELYAVSSMDCARALRDAGAQLVYLAGRPGDDEVVQREAGVGRYAYAGCDALSLLDEALSIVA